MPNLTLPISPLSLYHQLDTNGNTLWARSVTGLGRSYFYGVSTDSASGAAFPIGGITAQTTVSPSIVLTPTSSTNAFVVRYNTDGTVAWATLFTSSDPNAVINGYGTAYGASFLPCLLFGAHVRLEHRLPPLSL